MPVKNDTRAAPVSTNPRPIDLYMRWLAEVDHIVRRAFHSDERLLADACCQTHARAVRVGIVEAEGGQRFAAILASSRQPIGDEALADADLLAARRRAVRDALAVIVGRRDGEDWDALYQRTRKPTLHALGYELKRLGVIRTIPAYDPYQARRAPINTTMSTAPSDAEDVMA